MTTKYVILLAAITTLALGDTPPKTVNNPSLLRLLNGAYSNLRLPKTQWSYLYDYDSSNHQFQEKSFDGSIRNQATYPFTSESTVGKTVVDDTTENPSPYIGYAFSSQEYWNPNYWKSVNASLKGSYSKPYSGHGWYSNYDRDALEGSHATYRYQQSRPTKNSLGIVKRFPPHYFKNQIKGVELIGKPKYKLSTATSQYKPTTYNFNSYPFGLHKQQTKLKYTPKKTVLPYKRYYRSPFQRYGASFSSDGSRLKIQAPGYLERVRYDGASANPTVPASRHQTTERMDDAYLSEGDGEDADAKSNSSYYEAYEEVENNTSEPSETSHDETTTRNYYGDRIYMSTQVPLKTSDEATPKNKYYIIRRTTGDDDIETIFE